MKAPFGLSTLFCGSGRRILNHTLRRIGTALRRPTSLSLVLLLLALSVSVSQIAANVRGLNLALLLPLTLLAAGLSWLMAGTRLAGWLGSLLLASGGVGLVTWRIGGLGEYVGPLLLAPLAWLAEPAPRPPLSETVGPAGLALREALITLSLRVSGWAEALLNGAPRFDPVAVTLVWGLGLWLLGAWAGWWLKRHRQGVVSLGPVGVVLALSFGSAGHTDFSLLGFMAVWLILLAWLTHSDPSPTSTVGPHEPPPLTLDALLAVCLLTASVVGVAGLSPNITLTRLQNAAEGLLQPFRPPETLVLSFGLQAEASAFNPLNQARQGGLPRRHLLGSEPELAQQAVMNLSLSPTELPGRLYWRTLTYAHYTGRGWDGGRSTQSQHPAGESLWQIAVAPLGGYTNVMTVQQQIEVVDPLALMGLVPALGPLTRLDQPATLAWRDRSAGDMFGAQVAPALDSYRVEALWLAPSEAELRAASSRYPDSVLRHYTHLPENVSPRVAALALNLTATQPTAYDQALALERYLRQFPYDLAVPAPPPGVEVVDYFLFDVQRGYCDYYASAMVVLARAAGLPARLAVGFVAPEATPDGEAGRYAITQAQAHSWPEVYFPEVGWVRFEPTAGLPALNRPTAGTVSPPESANSAGWGRAWAWPSAGQVGWGVGLGLTLGVAWLTVSEGWRRWRVRYLPPAQSVAQIYRWVQGYGPRLGVRVSAGQTASEFLAEVGAVLAQEGYRRNQAARIALAMEALRWLEAAYLQAQFSPHRLPPETNRQAARQWLRLRRGLWVAGWEVVWGFFDR